MPAPEDTRASAQAGLDIGALYARLQSEVARTTGTEGSGWAELRDLAERYRAIGARGSLRRQPGVRGALVHSAKRALQPLLAWYVEPIVREQRMFNDAALKLIDLLDERLGESP
ncbi:MAG: hypothetical protein ACJ74P_13755 [Gaiellaceae bacterium]